MSTIASMSLVFTSLTRGRWDEFSVWLGLWVKLSDEINHGYKELTHTNGREEAMGWSDGFLQEWGGM